ncbi:MAG TPA: RNA polymerase sigma factor RpoD/SigA [Candidatus Polarisedimenticolia bacterium]|nr:RNA polymerase sigma factor RpoD/SigA [Candidatus Polarisedimenticolia bacterium]
MGETPVLDRERERALAVRASCGRDAAARDQLILANLRFAFSFCRRFQGLGLSLEELVAEGHIGLIEAADRFDPSRNVRFISYAMFWIRRAIFRALASHASQIPMPPKQYAKLRSVRGACRTLSERLGREPDSVEVGAALGISAEEVQERMSAACRVISLEDATVGGALGARGDQIGDRPGGNPELSLQRSESRRLVLAGLRDLLPRERFVLERRFGLRDDVPLSLSEVSRMVGVSREMVRLIEERARGKLRRRLGRARRGGAAAPVPPRPVGPR